MKTKETSIFGGGYIDSYPEMLERTNAVLAAVNIVAAVLPQLPVETRNQVLDACYGDGVFAVAQQIVS